MPGDRDEHIWSQMWENRHSCMRMHRLFILSCGVFPSWLSVSTVIPLRYVLQPPCMKGNSTPFSVITKPPLCSSDADVVGTERRQVLLKTQLKFSPFIFLTAQKITDNHNMQKSTSATTSAASETCDQLSHRQTSGHANIK